MFLPYSLLQKRLKVDTTQDTLECCFTVGGDVLDAPSVSFNTNKII